MVHCGCSPCCKFDFGLRWASKRDFTRSQWNLPQCLFLLYRVIALIYTCGYQIYYWIERYYPDSYTYVTNWTYLILTFYVVIAAVNLIVDWSLHTKTKPKIPESDILGLRYMVQWVLYDIFVTWSIIVAIVYWGLLYQQQDDIIEWFNNISNHLLPAVFGLLEVAITATPCCFVHFVYPVTYGLLYLTFTLIHWAAGYDPIYGFLDYNEKPIYTMVTLLCLAAASFLLYVMVWALTKLRTWVAGKTASVHRGEYEVQPDRQVTTDSVGQVYDNRSYMGFPDQFAI